MVVLIIDFYWSSTRHGSNNAHFFLKDNNISTQFAFRTFGYAIRCVDKSVFIPVTNIAVNKTATTLAVAEVEFLTTTATPANATNQSVTWASSDTSVATINTEGKVTAISAGTATITATTDNGATATTAVTVVPASTTDAGVVINGVRWATRNVGGPGTFAAYPESPGMLFQWNRRVGCPATGEAVDFDPTGSTSTVWYAENDPCPTGWRVPTLAEFESLILTSIWTTQNGVYGRLFGTAPYQIFLPRTNIRVMPVGRISSSMGGAYLYWTGTFLPSWSPLVLSFSSIRLNHSGAGPFLALPVRCVAED